MKTKIVWLTIYAVIASLSFAAGAGFFGEHATRTNVDWVFITVSLLTAFVFPPLALFYARSRTSQPFLRPSFMRGFNGGWWSDPLQCLRVSILVLGCLVLGALLSLQHASAQGIMVFWWQSTLLLGFVLGERLAYRLFRGDIA